MRSSSGNRRACSRPRRLRIGDPDGRGLGASPRTGPCQSISAIGLWLILVLTDIRLPSNERAIQRRVMMRPHPTEDGTMVEPATAGGRSPDVIVVGGGVTGTS